MEFIINLGDTKEEHMNDFKNCVVLFMITFLFTNTSFAQEEIVFSGWEKDIPFNWVADDSEKMVGAIVDVLRDFFKEHNIKMKTRVVPWKRALQDLEKGKIDVIGAIYLTDEREKFAAFSIPHSTLDGVVIVLRAKPIVFNRWEDLIEKKGGTVRGLSFGKEFDAFLKKNLKVEGVGTLDQNLEKLKRGRISYILEYEFSARMELLKREDSSQFMVLPKRLSEDKCYLAFSKKSPYKKYLPSINEKLQQMLDDGSLQELFDKYLKKAALE